MKTGIRHREQTKRGSLVVAYLIIMLIVSASIAALGSYVVQTSKLTQRRNNLVAATQFAEGGAVIAVRDLNTAVTAPAGGTVFKNITNISYAPYTLSSSLGGTTYKVYTRTIAANAPFTNQTVSAQIWITNTPAPGTARIITTATVGSVTQTATVNTSMAFGYGAAILSVNDGTSDTSVAKSAAQNGNVVVYGSAASAGGAPPGPGPPGPGGPGGGPSAASGTIVVYGGTNGLAVLANGHANFNTNFVSSANAAISQTNYAGGTPIPDYTAQGNSNTLFDINRFVAVANATTNGFAPSGNNHFTNVQDFVNAANLYNPVVDAGGKNAMEGVIVVDISQNDKGTGDFKNDGKSGDANYGINVRGTLVFNFVGNGWTPTSGFAMDTPMNVNPADLSHLVATNPATYTTGYPPVYSNSAYNPININITGQVDPATGQKDFANFAAGDDLPAVLYNIGEVDMHGPMDISGAMYTPSYMEIENKNDITTGNIQYIMGELIMGNGIYYENANGGTSIIAYDPNSVNNLTTEGNAGKSVVVTYWQ
jgi:hypothetical protein